jgi:Ca2+-transporting ATPase
MIYRQEVSMEILLSKHWHHVPSEEVVKILGSHPEKGLDLFEVKHRQDRFGLNILTPKKKKGPIRRFLLQFHNPLVYILILAGSVTAWIKDMVDAATIFGVVLINAVVGYIQESKAERAIEALEGTLNTEAVVVRGGKTLHVPSSELVPGDVVSIQSGSKVPADLRLIRSRDLQVAEAALTGESAPVNKDASLLLPEETVLADRQNMVYASTLVTYGQGLGVVTATGDKTEVGRISELISEAQSLETPLTRKITRFSHFLLVAILLLAAATFFIGTVRGQPIIDTFMAAIALAVSAIPEGLPAAVTITLAIGVSRMARRRAIIRKLPAVETLGSTTVICSDKTGTLTQNQMTVQHICTVDTCFDVRGTGYTPKGEIFSPDESFSPDHHRALKQTLEAGMLCNDSELREDPNGEWIAEGDPTEVALIVSAMKSGIHRNELNQQYPRLDVIPFESAYQYMATLHSAGPDQAKIAYVKGAAEVILAKCGHASTGEGVFVPFDISAAFRKVEEMARKGLRILAFAFKEIPAEKESLSHEDISHGLVFLGMQAMIDPPRPEAIAAVKACQDAGINIKMITGDHALTASAIALQLGLKGRMNEEGNGLLAFSGREMAGFSDEELIEAAREAAVFARVSPEQKLRLVEALQARGEVVAMTGDGVNDAPALKQADIGIAMGITGTDVSKEAADMVLTDDNFASIEAAVEEGRGVYDNLIKFIAWALPTNVGQGLVLLASVLAGVELPMLPVQVLWINMTTAGILGIALALEPREENIMNRPPRDPGSPILTGDLLGRILIMGLVILIGAFGLFEWEKLSGTSTAEARTVAVNTVAVVGSFYLLNCRSMTRSIFQLGFFSNPWVHVGILGMILLQMSFTYLPFMNYVMSSAPIQAEDWLRIGGVGLAGYLIVEFEKWIRRRISKRREKWRQAS